MRPMVRVLSVEMAVTQTTVLGVEAEVENVSETVIRDLQK
jgi:hypothetical protein